MRPLNYAILKYFTKVEEASAENVIKALSEEYGRFKALNKSSVTEALMTAEANGILSEGRYEMNAEGELRVFYYASKEGIEIINKYIPD